MPGSYGGVVYKYNKHIVGYIFETDIKRRK
jgi:hypothetical protein